MVLLCQSSPASKVKFAIFEIMWSIQYNTSHNKSKELLPIKIEFKVDKNPM